MLLLSTPRCFVELGPIHHHHGTPSSSPSPPPSPSSILSTCFPRLASLSVQRHHVCAAAGTAIPAEVISPPLSLAQASVQCGYIGTPAQARDRPFSPPRPCTWESLASRTHHPIPSYHRRTQLFPRTWAHARLVERITRAVKASYAPSRVAAAMTPASFQSHHEPSTLDGIEPYITVAGIPPPL